MQKLILLLFVAPVMGMSEMEDRVTFYAEQHKIAAAGSSIIPVFSCPDSRTTKAISTIQQALREKKPEAFYGTAQFLVRNTSCFDFKKVLAVAGELVPKLAYERDSDTKMDRVAFAIKCLVGGDKCPEKSRYLAFEKIKILLELCDSEDREAAKIARKASLIMCGIMGGTIGCITGGISCGAWLSAGALGGAVGSCLGMQNYGLVEDTINATRNDNAVFLKCIERWNPGFLSVPLSLLEDEAYKGKAEAICLLADLRKQGFLKTD